MEADRIRLTSGSLHGRITCNSESNCACCLERNGTIPLLATDIGSDASTKAHERYLAIYDLVRKRDKELARIFDGLTRSDAKVKLLLMYRAGLITEDELASLSEDVRGFMARSLNPDW